MVYIVTQELFNLTVLRM